MEEISEDKAGRVIQRVRLLSKIRMQVRFEYHFCEKYNPRSFVTDVSSYNLFITILVI